LAELWVTCSRIQPLSTSLPAEHEYCEAVSTEQWADSVCCLCCCSRLVSIAPPARKFLSAPPTSAASEQLFSAAGQTYSDRRSSLLGENAEKLLFLAYNIRLFDFKYTEVCIQNNWRSEIYSRLKCELVIMGLSRNILFSCICYFMLLQKFANHNRNHNQICIASWTELQRRWIY